MTPSARARIHVDGRLLIDAGDEFFGAGAQRVFGALGIQQKKDKSRFFTDSSSPTRKYLTIP